MPDASDQTFLSRHRISIALIEPQIAPNTGNVARLCVAAGTDLHLVRPLGFVLSDQNLRRSAMDYWPRLKLTLHDDIESFVMNMEGSRLWMFSSKAKRSFWDVKYSEGDCLVFGNETHGLPSRLVDRDPDHCLRIPQIHGERCLNLSTSAGIALYETMRQLDGGGSFRIIAQSTARLEGADR